VSKNVAVFVDVANIFYAAKAAGVDIDYVTLLKAASAGRDLVRAYAYTGLDPENENQRQFHAFLARNGYKVVSKDIRKYGDGKVKANLDIELVVDLMRTSRNLDIAVVVSGDGDFAPAIRAVQQTGTRVEVISFRGNTSSDLIDVADVFTDITQIARVERSSRSGRRVAAEEEDLSMTEVPDKETEGASRRRRGRHGEGREEVRRDDRPGERRERAVPSLPVAQAVPGGIPIVVLPGEKLSKAAAIVRPPIEEEAAGAALAEEPEAVEGIVIEASDAEGLEAGHRRRRRRGGRGRGRGRGHEAEVVETGSVADEAEAEAEEELEVEAPRVPQHSTFGSVWDSQLGMPTAPVGSAQEMDEEELEEPEIPEYLLAERRQRGAPRGGRPVSVGRSGRGRGSYQQAVERERYGRGAPAGGRGPRVPERGPRPQFDRPARNNRPAREPQAEERQASTAEPWSEVPADVAELLRAEMARRGGARPEQPGRQGPSTQAQQTLGAEAERASSVSDRETGEGPTPGAQAAGASARGTRTRGGRGHARTESEPVSEAGAAEEAAAAAGGLADAAPRPRTRRARPTVPVRETAAAEEAATNVAPARGRARAGAGRAKAVTAGEEPAVTPARTRARRSPATAGTSTSAPEIVSAAAGDESAAPRKRTRRVGPASGAEGQASVADASSPTPRRARRTPSAPEA
jgi:uncharacterized LabA/DUF88 family protein